MEKFKVTVIYGTEVVESAQEAWYFSGDGAGQQQWLEEHEDDLICREFDTEAEMNAYIKGIDDLSNMVDTIILT